MKKAILGVGLAAVAAVSVWKLSASDAPRATHGDDLVVDRIWIDHLPRNDRDTFQVFLALTEQPFGVFQASSQWKGAYEIFRYEKHGGELRLLFPQDGSREKVRTKARRCDEKGMDYCLELDGASRGVKKYYSMEGWEIDGIVDDVRAKVEQKVRAR